MTWILPADLAHTMSVSPRTIQKWCRERRIPHVRVGRVYRFTPEMVQQIADAYRVERVELVEVDTPNPAYAPRAVVVPMVKQP